MISKENLAVLRDCARLEFPEIHDIFFEEMRFTAESRIKLDGEFSMELQFTGGARYSNRKAICDAIVMMPECSISPDADYVINRSKWAEFDGVKYPIRIFFYVAMPEEDVEFLMEMGNLVKEDREREVSYGVVCDL